MIKYFPQITQLPLPYGKALIKKTTPKTINVMNDPQAV